MEIGSEFWKKDEKFIYNNEECFLLGRTALDAIIRDAISEHRITSALLPSYACHTMIEPFKRNGIHVRFYDVYIKRDKLVANIPAPRTAEIFYAMTYFGNEKLENVNPDTQEWEDLWDVTIEDITHSCFNMNKEFVSDYRFTSFRKWMALDGFAIAKKKNGEFRDCNEKWKMNKKYNQMRNKAYDMKHNFLEYGEGNKEDFLKLFEDAENFIINDYVGYRPDINAVIRFYIESRNIDQFRTRRQENAKRLIEGIKDISNITVLFEYSNAACPLFVPVAVSDDIRNDLRNYLIAHEIYCPIHWPLSEIHEGISDGAKGIYNQELSLICDQRYNSDDIDREIEVIRNYFKEIGYE